MKYKIGDGLIFEVAEPKYKIGDKFIFEVDEVIEGDTTNYYICEGLNSLVLDEVTLGKMKTVEPECGEWINRFCGAVWAEQYCSKCEFTIEDEPMDYSFCPNCGAKMSA